MIDIVKVREGLRCCRDGDNCTACPYYESNIDSSCDELIRQAYELLRPQLLTKDELQGAGRPFTVWVEDKIAGDKALYQVATVDGWYVNRSGCCCFDWSDDGCYEEYGKTWRCWTQWPSEEDRRREAWDDEH